MVHLSHAKTADLPGWPYPSRVRDILDQPESWGFVDIERIGIERTIVQDEDSFLWAKGSIVLICKVLDLNDKAWNPGALVFWTKNGLGLWVHPNSYQYISLVNRRDMANAWIPVVETPKTPPLVHR